MKPLLLAASLCLVAVSPALRAETPMAFPAPGQLPVIKDMPDPLTFMDGSPVKTAEQWSRRRDEIKALAQYYTIGHSPPAPGNVRAEVLKSQVLSQGKVSYQLLRLSFGPNSSLSLHAALFLPVGVKGPVPTIVFLSFAATPGDEIPAHPDPKYKTVEAEAFARDRSDVLSQGYAILTFLYTEAAADRADNKGTGFFPAYPGYDWGSLAVWAWGASRCVDYLETQPFVDKERIILVGHSRLGKTTLVAGALDDRFSLVVPAGSGCGGTGAFRVNGKARGGKEGLEELTAHFPHWLVPRAKEFAGQVDKLPFDQNCLMALIAPRPLLMTEAYGDPFCNGKAAVASFVGTRGTYHFLQADDRLGIHYRQGGHALTDDDWQTIIDFTNHELRDAPARNDFHAVPDPSLLH